jgi:hypothetical protein
MADKSVHRSNFRRPGPQGLWGSFWLLVVLVVMGGVAPAVHAEPTPAEVESGAKVFGEGANMADKTQPEAQPQAQPLPGEGQAQAADEPKSAPADDKKPAYLSEDQPLQLKDYEEPKAAEPAPWWQQVLGFGFKLLMVIGLIFGSLAAVKKLSGGRMAATSWCSKAPTSTRSRRST